MGEAVAALLRAVVEVALIFTGKAVITLVSFGRWRSESLSGAEGRIYGPAGALSFKREGQRVFTPTGLPLIGVVFYVLLLLALLWFTSLP